MNDKEQFAALGSHMADRAMELFETKSPHQLAVELVDAQDRIKQLTSLLVEVRGLVENDYEFPTWMYYHMGDVLAGKVPEPAMPDGWQLVPVEPTEVMRQAVETDCDYIFEVASHDQNIGIDADKCCEIYRAMLAAAPKPEGA